MKNILGAIIGFSILAYIGGFSSCGDNSTKTKEVNTTTQDNIEKSIQDANIKAANEYENNMVELPKSDLIPNPNNTTRQGTRGVAYINGNYYVGYYCGLKEVWDASDSAITAIFRMQKHKNDESNIYYKDAFEDVKILTPYIKEIQDSTLENADPYEFESIIKQYMKDTVIMNYKYADQDMNFKLEEIFRHNYLVDTFGSWKFNDIVNMASKSNDEKYQSLNQNILE